MFRSLIIAGLLVSGLTACSAEQMDKPAAAAAPVRDEAAFVKEARTIPELLTWNPNVTDAQIVSTGDTMCSYIGKPDVTREALIQQIGVTPIGPRGAAAFVVAIEGHLCPGNRYASPSVNTPGYVAPVAQPVAPVAVGPATPINARDWQLVAKDPASHAGQRIIVYGNVTQFDSGTGTSAFRANVDGVAHRVKYGYIDYQTNTMLTGDAAALANVVQGDLFTAEVTVSGPYTYNTTMGGQMTAPMLNVTKLTVTGHIAH